MDWMRGYTPNHGLSVSSAYPVSVLAEDYYAQCAPNKSDCRARKGFVLTEVHTHAGPVLMLTTHLDAGRTPEDHAARATQLAELKAALVPYAGRPLILVGDLNLSTNDPVDDAQLQAFLQSLGLTVHARQSGRGHDVIAARGVEFLEKFEYDQPDLTDHALQLARFRLPHVSAPVIAQK